MPRSEAKEYCYSLLLYSLGGLCEFIEIGSFHKEKSVVVHLLSKIIVGILSILIIGSFVRIYYLGVGRPYTDAEYILSQLACSVIWIFPLLSTISLYFGGYIQEVSKSDTWRSLATIIVKRDKK